MTQMRRTLAPVAAIWLLCQLGTLALLPVMLSSGAAARHAAECSCGHGADAMCPMHHKAAASPAHCAMQAGNGTGTAVLTSLAGIAGLLPESAAPFGSARPSVGLRSPDLHPTGERPVPPDPPPPRA